MSHFTIKNLLGVPLKKKKKKKKNLLGYFI